MMIRIVDFLSDRVDSWTSFLSKHVEVLDRLWIASSKAIDRLFFEMLISSNIHLSLSGVSQLLIDLNALFSPFSKFARKPEAFFKRLKDVKVLLLLDSEKASSLRFALSEETNSMWRDESKKREELNKVGVKVVSPVLVHRLLQFVNK